MGNKHEASKTKVVRGWFGRSFQPQNFIPGLVIGFIFGILLDLTKPITNLRTNNHRLLSNSTHPHEDFKMVLVVRQDLKMGQGKVASQCAHAATGLYAKLMQRFALTFFHLVGLVLNSISPRAPYELVLQDENIKFIVELLGHEVHMFSNKYVKMYTIFSHQSLLRRWERCGQAKIVVTCKNQQEMNKLLEAAEVSGLPTYVVADAGRTQVSAGSKTVLAIGPGYKSVVDSVTGKQRLL